MLDLTDPRWSELQGGYRVPYDPRPALAKLEREATVPKAWKELWNSRHHQGDVGTASYAAVPHLVRVHKARGVADWNTYALMACIEHVRHADGNPALPAWLKDGYECAWSDVVGLALADLAQSSEPTLVRAAFAVIATARGLTRLGKIILNYDEDELARMIDDFDG